MPRLIDDIRARRELEVPFFVKHRMLRRWWNVSRQIWPALLSPDLPVVSIDSETRYYFEGTDQEHWDIRADFPSLRPPHRVFWAEALIPKRIVSEECGVTYLGELLPHGRIGFLVTTLDRCHVEGEAIPEGTSSILWVELFIDYGGGRIEGPHGSIFMAVDAGGGVIGLPRMHSFGDAKDIAIIKKFTVWLNPLLLSMSSARERMREA